MKTGWKRTAAITAAMSVLTFSSFFLDSCRRQSDLRKANGREIMAPIQKEKTAQEQTAQKDSLTVSIRPIAPAGKKLEKESVYAKADSEQQKMALSPKARELALERLKEIDKEDSIWIEKIQIPVRGDGRPPLKPETIDSAMKINVFNYWEKRLYDAALNGNTLAEIEECKKKIVEKGKIWKDSAQAERILQRFEKIVAG